MVRDQYRIRMLKDQTHKLRSVVPGYDTQWAITSVVAPIYATALEHVPRKKPQELKVVEDSELSAFRLRRLVLVFLRCFLRVLRLSFFICFLSRLALFVRHVLSLLEDE